MAEEPQHWPTERMVLEGHADYATEEDLQALDDGLLNEIAKLCEVPEYAGPGECVPCTAAIMVIERENARHAEALARLTPSEPVYPEPEPDSPADLTTPPENAPNVTETFHVKVQELALLTEQMLAGPPIPPPGVTLTELGALVLGAKRWLALIEAQGIELAPAQEAVRAEIARVVGRLDRG